MLTGCKIIAMLTGCKVIALLTCWNVCERSMCVVLQFIVSELLFPMAQISQLYHLPRVPMQSLGNGREMANICFSSLSGGYNETSTPDKASLITYFGTQCGLLLDDLHHFSAKQNISYRRTDGKVLPPK